MEILYIGNKLAVHGKSPTTIDTLGTKFEEMGMQVHYASSKINKLKRLLDMAVSTVKLRRKVNYVCIDTYSKQSFYFTLVVAFVCRVFKIKYYTFLHGGKLPERLQQSPFLCDLIFKHSVLNIAPSGYLKHFFDQKGYKNNIIIPNSVEIEDYAFKKRTQIKPNILYVRHFAAIYNPQMAVNMFAKVKQKYPEATLNFVGEDKDGSLEECKELAKDLGVIDSIIFSGRLPRHEWHQLSQNYDIFINTTNIDNTPVSLIEAMALGLPIVTTNVGGIPYLVEDHKNALLVNAGDEDAMASKVIELLEQDSLVERLSVNGRQLSESFSWEKIMLKWQQIFKNE